MRQLKIGTSSIRGIVGDSLTPEMLVDFASAFGTFCDKGAVVVGRDTRHSSTMVHAAVLSSLLSAGCRVIDLGVCPTPLVSFAVRDSQASGGIAITGSHNDIRWNALKFLASDGTLLNPVASEELLDIYHAKEFTHVTWDELQAVEELPAIADRYLTHLLTALDVERIRAQKFRVAVDFCNGAAAPLTMRFLAALGCTAIPLNEEPDDDFAHAPAPTPDNMRQLASLMRYFEADIGIAMNIDGDRIGLVTADGHPLSEEYTFPILADHYLSRTPGPVVTNLSTSRMIEEVARCYGQQVIRTQIGEGYVMNAAMAERAAIAGEGSGGVAIPASITTFDAFLSLGMVLEAMAVTGESLTGLMERLPQLFIRKGTLSCPPNIVYQIIDDFRDRYASDKPNLTEGVRVEWADAWMHIRASNTEPLLRVIVESNDATRTDAIYEDIMGQAARMAFGHVTH